LKRTPAPEASVPGLPRSTATPPTTTSTSSWLHGATGDPFGFTIGASPSQVIPGWDTGLAGQTVGSRVLLSVPPAPGYGP